MKSSRRRGRGGFELLLLPKDGAAARRLHVSKQLWTGVVVALLLNGLLVVALFVGFGGQRVELQRKQSEIAALQQRQRELLVHAEERELRVMELSAAAEALTARLRQLEQLSDEVWTLLGETPDEAAFAPAEEAGRGGPDGAADDLALQASLMFGSVSSQARLQLRELEQLRQHVLERNHRLAHTPDVWPVSGVVSSEYGVRRHPISGNQQLHAGIDIAAPRGTKVVATADGVVAFAGDRGGYGLTVVVDHGYGIQTLYAHNSALHVRKGDVVARGDLLSSVGSTGVSTGPHLHYEVHVNGATVNPRAYLP